jgi:NAD(P)-dependent dehydrogenase (short-subunit alcohol dehydrogenase family)
MASIGRFLYRQLFITPPKPTGNLTGKTVIVTGSNVGLGKEAARHFAQLNASKVILAVRSLEKGEAARKDIESTTGRSDVVRVMQLDMSSYQSVLDFAQKASKELERVDIAVLNAGVNRGVWEVFEQDESTITVNVVSTFLLAFALLPKLKETASKFNTRPTLTIVSSEVHEWASFEERKAPEGKIFERLNEKVVNGKEVGLSNRYQVSKLLEVLFIRAFCQRYPKSDLSVTVNYVNPGFCHS